ncbi:MAG: hypothetical protein ABJJ92_03010 [Tateyamaria sp.]
MRISAVARRIRDSPNLIHKPVLAGLRLGALSAAQYQIRDIIGADIPAQRGLFKVDPARVRHLIDNTSKQFQTICGHRFGAFSVGMSCPYLSTFCPNVP